MNMGSLLRRGCSWFTVLAILNAPYAAANTGRAWTQFRKFRSNNAALGGDLDVTWQTHVDGRISASPTYAAGVIYAGTNAGTLYALRAGDGSIVWKSHVRNALMSAPLIYHGLVIDGEGNDLSEGRSALVAFDQRTGAVRWRLPLAGSGMPNAAIIAGVLVHQDAAGTIAGVNPLTGHVLYERNVHSLAWMSSALPVSHRRFVTAGVRFNAVMELDARSGATVWRSNPFPPGASGFGDCPLASDGVRIFGDYVVPAGNGTWREHAYALNVASGALVWDTPLQAGSLPERNEAAVPTVVDGVLYLGNAIAPWANALDAKNGRVLWKKQVSGPVKGAMVVRGSDVYFGDLGGYLWALDARTGSQIGVEPLPTSFNVGSPIIVGKTLIIGSFTHTIYAAALQSIRSAAM